MSAPSRYSPGRPRLAALLLAPFCWLAAGVCAGADSGTPAGTTGTATLTFNKDVAPLVFQHCAGCHRPGEVAPFPLLSFRDVSKRARLIASVTSERVMPPWKAEHGVAHFADERRLTDDQIATIARWVEQGAVEGEPGDLPSLPTFTSGWQLGEPDLVVKMTEPYTLYADGRDEYRCFVLPFLVPVGKYLEAVEYRPGNRRIVHHAVLSSMSHAAAQAKLAAGDGKSFTSGLAPPGQLLPGPLSIWTPGMVPRPLPDGYAFAWPRGADLVLQLHLHPSGKSETEQSLIGFHFTDEKPKGRLNLMIVSNRKINIPAGEANYSIEATQTIDRPVDVHGIFPHMHMIGRTVKVTATLPDGSVEPLLAINDWDFNWQNYFRYETPVHLPAGTRIDGHFTYDNSDENPANPSQPPKAVTYGEQTVNEMAIAILDVIATGPAPELTPEARAARVELFRRAAERATGRLDKDGNGKLDLDELTAGFAQYVEPAEIEKIFKRFDHDDDKLLNLSELTEALDAMSPR